MTEQDQPPQAIWLNDDALTEHFERVKQRYSSGAALEEDVPAALDQNELTKGLR